MTLEKLKAHAYDVLAQIEALQKELQATNILIRDFKQPEEAEELCQKTSQTETN